MMYPLSGFYDIALGYLMVDTTVKDVTYSTASGKDTQSAPVTRTIQAAIDQSDHKQLEIIFGGSLPDGSIGIWTKEVLHYTDDSVSGTAMNKAQSFVLDSAGLIYRVVKIADWTSQTGFYVYLAQFHMTQDLI